MGPRPKGRPSTTHGSGRPAKRTIVLRLRYWMAKLTGTDCTYEELRGFDDFDVRLGDVLRGERATRGCSIMDVEREIKIRASYIAAIENADPTVFATPGFIAGFVRSYARYLGVDPDWAYEQFCDECNIEQTDLKKLVNTSQTELPEETIPVQSKVLKGPDVIGGKKKYTVPKESVLNHVSLGAVASVFILVVLLSGIGYGGFMMYQKIDSVQDPSTRTASLEKEIDPLLAGISDPFQGSVPGISADASPERQNEGVFAGASKTETMIDIAPGSLGVFASLDADQKAAGGQIQPALPDASQEGPALAAAAPELAVALAEGETEVTVAAAQPAPVKIAAVNAAWISVSDEEGTILFEGILDAGASYELPERDGRLALRAGNSGSVYVVIGDEAFGPLGEGSQIVKNMDLAQASVRAAFEPKPLAAVKDPKRVEVAEKN